MNDLDVLENKFDAIISIYKSKIDDIYDKHMKWIHDAQTIIDTKDLDGLIEFFESEEIKWFYSDNGGVTNSTIRFQQDISKESSPKRRKPVKSISNSRISQQKDNIHYDPILDKKYNVSIEPLNELRNGYLKGDGNSKLNELINVEKIEPLKKKNIPKITKDTSKQEIKNIFLNYLHGNLASSNDEEKDSLTSYSSSDCITDSYLTDVDYSLSPISNSPRHIQDNYFKFNEVNSTTENNNNSTSFISSNSEEIFKERSTIEEGPEWTHKDKLIPILKQQAKLDPDKIFPDITNIKCNLEKIFGKRKFRCRTSSSNWSMDLLKEEENMEYKRLMGFSDN